MLGLDNTRRLDGQAIRSNSEVMRKTRTFYLLATLAVVAFVGLFANARASVSLTDDVGAILTRDKEPQRIIALAPELVELVYAMGCGNKLVARTQFSNYPVDALKLPSIGTYIQPNFEQIIALKPDLVLATGRGNPKEIPDKLRSLGVRTYTYFPSTISDLQKSIQNLGRAIGCDEGATHVAKTLLESLQAVKAPETITRPNVLVLVNGDPLFAVGPGTLGDTLINWVGGQNIIDGNARYPRIGLELILERQPDVLVLAHQGGPCDACVPAYWQKLPIPAAKNGMIVTLDPDLLSRAGPRLVAVAQALKTWIDAARAGKVNP
jgi:iron complex transport system substrate-binding protein